MKVRPILLTYVVTNAILYSMVLPLWEGFDEPFHFGYVQWLADGRGFPDQRSSLLSREVGDSILAAPASVVVQRNLPQVKTYSEYFSWPRAKRAEVRRALNGIRPELRAQPSGFLNYEAQHAPLAYVALAVPERALARVPLPTRVLVLRIIAALAGGLLLYFAVDLLFAELGVREPYRNAAAFCVFSCQMTWATIAHVGNDWLAVPLTVWVLVAAIRYWKKPERRRLIWVAGVLSLGLLTKAYFVALIPAALAPCVLLRRWKHLCAALAMVAALAGPWYAFNVHRYGSFTGMQEARSGIGVASVIRAAPELNWPKIAFSSARAALWTGNNTFSSFSAATLFIVIAALAIAVLMWALTRHSPPEWIAVCHLALFAAALGYKTAVDSVLAPITVTGPSPWYSQVLLAPALGLAFLGCCRRPKWGRLPAAALVALFGYVLIATYIVKLIPLYGGYEGRTSLASLAVLYSTRLSELLNNLDFLALAPSRAILGGAAAVAALAVLQVVVLIRAVFGSGARNIRCSA